MPLSQQELQIDLTPYTLPKHIVIEGAIGIGKTTLAKNLARSFDYTALLEQPSQNPFLEHFYQNAGNNALATQLHFLFQRIDQLQQQNINPSNGLVCDFMIEKDLLFAEVTLSKAELDIYKRVYESQLIPKTQADLVIYLQAPTDVLLKRIQKRGIDVEQSISASYLNQLNDSYLEFFHRYTDTTLLIVNAADINVADNAQQYKNLLDYALNLKSGRHYYNPLALETV